MLGFCWCLYLVVFLDDRNRCVQGFRTQGVVKDSGSSQCEQSPLECDSKTDPFMTAAVVCLIWWYSTRSDLFRHEFLPNDLFNNIWVWEGQ
jgi:hypothetical protein